MYRTFIMQLLLLTTCVMVMVAAQRKPGECPPPVEGVAFMRCYRDTECIENLKCCRTSNGGSSCTNPLTSVPPVLSKGEKPGTCPSKPGGEWVCSGRCSSDADCIATNKCCKNRCGALACMKPE